MAPHGIAPHAVLGQGTGELAAASVAGILTPEEALRLATDSQPRNGEPQRATWQPRRASLPFLSAVDGQRHSGTDLDAAHWRRCLGQPHRLAAAAALLAEQRVDICLEIGPPSLLEDDRRILAQNRPFGSITASWMTTDAGGVNLLSAVGTLYAAGAIPQWERLAPEAGHCVRVPTYPWQRQRLWPPVKNRWMEPRPSACDGEDSASDRSVSASPLEQRQRPDLTAPYVAPRTNLEAALVQSWSEILHMQGIGIHDNFFELGGDSLQATILLNHLEERLGETVPGHALFQVQCINDLAAYLRDHCPNSVGRHFPDELLAVDVAVANGSQLPAGCDQDTVASGHDTSGFSIPRLARDQQVDDLLARIDELGSDEVEALLRAEAAGGEVTDE